jgi:hypothetical protein
VAATWGSAPVPPTWDTAQSTPWERWPAGVKQHGPLRVAAPTLWANNPCRGEGKQHPQSRGSSPWRHGCQSGFRGGTRSRVIGHLDRRRSAQTLARVTRHPDSRMGPPKPLHGRSPLAARTYTLSHRSQRVETQPRPPCGRSPVRQADPQRLYPSRTFRERSQTHAWAKPCLAGRPTALVRTQSPEQNTSRGRPSGMELPDYPVVVLTPTPWDQDGPTRNLPAGSFFKFVTRYASRPDSSC